MPRQPKPVSRKVLATYAAMTGRDSLAALALLRFDSLAAQGKAPTIHMALTGFTITPRDGQPMRFA